MELTDLSLGITMKFVELMFNFKMISSANASILKNGSSCV